MKRVRRDRKALIMNTNTNVVVKVKLEAVAHKDIDDGEVLIDKTCPLTPNGLIEAVETLAVLRAAEPRRYGNANMFDCWIEVGRFRLDWFDAKDLLVPARRDEAARRILAEMTQPTACPFRDAWAA